MLHSTATLCIKQGRSKGCRGTQHLQQPAYSHQLANTSMPKQSTFASLQKWGFTKVPPELELKAQYSLSGCRFSCKPGTPSETVCSHVCIWMMYYRGFWRMGSALMCWGMDFPRKESRRSLQSEHSSASSVVTAFLQTMVKRQVLFSLSASVSCSLHPGYCKYVWVSGHAWNTSV